MKSSNSIEIKQEEEGISMSYNAIGMEKTLRKDAYLEAIVDHFEGLSLGELSERTLTELKRSLANYLAGALYVGANYRGDSLYKFASSLDKNGGAARVWGEDRKLEASRAAFVNASRISSLELNDSTVGSTHPGIYVWSSLLAAYQEEAFSSEKFILAAVFGFELASRLALLSVESAMELGLHNPGLVGALAATASLALARDFGREKTLGALGLAGSLLPLSPFVSFMEGSASKDFYGGWGVHLAFMAIQAADFDLFGPGEILGGDKSLRAIFSGEGKTDLELGKPYYLDGLKIKEYPACFGVYPAVKALKKLLSRNSFSLEDFSHLEVLSYPYSVELSQGVKELNRTSARLSLDYCCAYTLRWGDLDLEAFTSKCLEDKKLRLLMEKISVKEEEAYGRGSLSRRAARLRVFLKDGRSLEEVFDASESSYLENSFLKRRLEELGRASLSNGELEELWDYIFKLEEEGALEGIIDSLDRIAGA